MVYKLLLFVIIFTIKTAYSNIIYDKNNILITDIEMNSYMNLYNDYAENSISKNEAIKNIVLIKRTIKFLEKNNPNFLSNLDLEIEKEFQKEIFSDQASLNFIRFQKIRNEFISEYFQNNFDIQDFEIIVSNFNNLKLPISKNKCLTIEKLHKFDNDKNFSKSLYNSLKNRKKEFEILINNQLYDVCINDQLYNEIENIIIKFIENKTEDDFNKFIYEKIN